MLRTGQGSQLNRTPHHVTHNDNDDKHLFPIKFKKKLYPQLQLRNLAVYFLLENNSLFVDRQIAVFSASRVSFSYQSYHIFKTFKLFMYSAFL